MLGCHGFSWQFFYIRKMKNLLLVFLAALAISCETLPAVYRSNNPVTPVKVDESQEFAELMEIDKKDKLQRAAEAVNQFVNDEPTDPQAAILIKNETNCNIIVRISGRNENHNIPVPKGDKNYLVLKKGSYVFKSNFCDSKYYSDKNITESVTITLTENYR